uniref:Isopenicillin N synthase-like Fe(2+) 2OG dioxygenase domain-containing protein n=2 Tax=Guillardia theta TaxID=55529 RepID=A0A7S4NG08_GUITH|mmetsp:Transcript_21458/g.71097  ORF Transcript_21458/g.71097 Transcript_21458/m.71097 type:complete len:360 (+) Transcript_21458:147-1226(+)
MDKGNHYEMLKDEVNVSPEYPYDVDVGPLICRKMNRCFLAGGELCGEYQQGNRQKGMLQDINSALNEGGFFFIFNTMITEAQLNDTYEHMAAMFKESETALGIDAPSPSGRGFSRRGIHSAEPGVIAEHLCFSFGKDHDLREPNLWPADIIRPGFKKDVSELFNELDFISDMLAKAFCDMLGVSPDTFRRLRTNSCMSEMQLLNFPPAHNIRTHEEGRQVARSTGWRTEPGLFSIINQTEPCFQVQNIHGKTCNLRCGSERFVVLVGDVVEVFTNGLIPATKYRVVPRTTERQAFKFAARLNPQVESSWGICLMLQQALVEVSPAFTSNDDLNPAFTSLTQVRELGCYVAGGEDKSRRT